MTFMWLALNVLFILGCINNTQSQRWILDIAECVDFYDTISELEKLRAYGRRNFLVTICKEITNCIQSNKDDYLNLAEYVLTNIPKLTKEEYDNIEKKIAICVADACSAANHVEDIGITKICTNALVKVAHGQKKRAKSRNRHRNRSERRIAGAITNDGKERYRPTSEKRQADAIAEDEVTNQMDIRTKAPNRPIPLKRPTMQPQNITTEVETNNKTVNQLNRRTQPITEVGTKDIDKLDMEPNKPYLSMTKKHITEVESKDALRKPECTRGHSKGGHNSHTDTRKTYDLIGLGRNYGHLGVMNTRGEHYIEDDYNDYNEYYNGDGFML